MLEGWEEVRMLRQELKTEWAELWRSKYEDEVRAEGVSSSEFERLFVNLGEIIYATRDFKPLSFSEILEKHVGTDLAAKAYPDPALGGWRRFVKEHIRTHKPMEKRERPKVKVDLSQHQRKSGAGWLNRARVLKKIKDSEYAD